MKNQLTALALSLITLASLAACGGGTESASNPFAVAPVNPAPVESPLPVASPQPEQNDMPDPTEEPIAQEPEAAVVAQQQEEPVAQEQAPEPVAAPPVAQETVVQSEEPAPEIFSPETGELIQLIRPRLDRLEIAGTQMVCDVVFWDDNLKLLIRGSNATTTWEHFADGTGEMMAFKGAPVPFEWSINIQTGAYESDLSPFAQEFAERVEYPNSAIAYRFWNLENTALEFYECTWN